MPFVHEDREAFAELVERASVRLDRDRFMIEKDYWVTHALFALDQAGFTVWFKGGTSLSKGFGLIERFSEDLDIKLVHPDIPDVSSWTSAKGKKHIASRAKFFAAVTTKLYDLSPFTAVEEEVTNDDGSKRNLQVRLEWPGRLHSHAADVMREYVLLEIGSSRVTPHVECPIRSWVHDELREVGSQDEFDDNLPTIRCLHPLVTLIEKLSIIEKRAPNEETPPDRFIRHYEDIARIARAHLDGRLPEHKECVDTRKLIDVMKRITREALTSSSPPAFHLDELSDARRQDLERAHAAIGLLFFGPRISLADCTATIREWIDVEVR